MTSSVSSSWGTFHTHTQTHTYIHSWSWPWQWIERQTRDVICTQLMPRLLIIYNSWTHNKIADAHFILLQFVGKISNDVEFRDVLIPLQDITCTHEWVCFFRSGWRFASPVHTQQIWATGGKVQHVGAYHLWYRSHKAILSTTTDNKYYVLYERWTLNGEEFHPLFINIHAQTSDGDGKEP